MTTPEQERLAKLTERYGASEQGNFYAKDTIGVPHPYCITPKHLDRDTFVLDRDAIERAEKRGAKCGMRGCTLSYSEHEQAVLVACKKELKNGDGKADPELHAYLLKCKPLAEEDKYAGFAFLDERA